MSGQGTPAAGALRVRLALEAPIATPDGAGGEAVVWSEIGRPWAELSPLDAGERYDFSRAEPALRWRVRIRFREGVSPAMRFRLGERVLEIRAAFDPDGRRRTLECLAEERGQ